MKLENYNFFSFFCLSVLYPLPTAFSLGFIRRLREAFTTGIGAKPGTLLLVSKAWNSLKCISADEWQ